MKIKLLLMPLIIAVVIMLLIWLVYPAYSNGADGVKERYAQWNKEKEKLSEIEKKSANIEGLSSQISSMAEEIQILTRFLPAKAKEEEIIDNLNFLAISSGLSTFEFTVEQIQKTEALNARLDVGADEELPSLPSPEDLDVNARLAGRYENIKTFLDKMDKFGRYGNFSKLKISKAQNVDGQSSDILYADMKISFNVLEEAKLSDETVNDPIFNENTLSNKIISRIKSERTEKVLDLDVGNKGKIDIFKP